MTYIGRFNHFECNDCGKKVAVGSFPEGWVTTRSRGGIPHHCDECAASLPEGTKVWPGGAKENECRTMKGKVK